jgi:hypothetical protein
MSLGQFGSFSSPEIDHARDLLDRLSQMEDERDAFAKRLREVDSDAYYSVLARIRRERA